MTKSRWTHGTGLPRLMCMTAQRIALVTGANQGIGYALVEELAARWTPEDLVLLTGRDQARVTGAATRRPRARDSRPHRGPPARRDRRGRGRTHGGRAR